LLNDRVSRHQTFLDTTIDSYLRLATAAGCEKESTQLEVATTLADETAMNAVWDQLDLPPGEEVIVFNSGGAYGAAKSWPVEHFAKLAERITADWGYSVLVNCGPAERDIAREIVAQSGSNRVKSLADVAELPIGLTKACIRRSMMLVSTDSGPRFFGIAFEKPVITLFGPTDPAATRTHYEGEVRMTLTLDCQPCMERTCPLLHHQCMEDLTPERVYRVVARQLQKASSAAA
jgi:heptosyltransferase-2